MIVYRIVISSMRRSVGFSMVVVYIHVVYLLSADIFYVEIDQKKAVKGYPQVEN